MELKLFQLETLLHARKLMNKSIFHSQKEEVQSIFIFSTYTMF